MKKILILVLVLANLLISKDFKNITLVDFIQILSHTTNKNFVISDTVNKDFHVYLPSNNFTDAKSSMRLLSNILKINDLDYKQVDDVYLIYKPKPIQPIIEDLTPVTDTYIIKYRYLFDEDIKVYLSSLFPSLKYSLLRGRILFTSTQEDYDLINKQIKILDSSYLQKNINISVISTSNDKLKDVGTDFKALHFDVSKYIELVTSTATFNTTLTSPTQFYAFINLMNTNGYSKLILNPSITLSDKKNSLIESTTNIPFLESQTSTKDNMTTTQNSYKYKDVGLKINFNNVVITETQINFDLDIYIQSILEKTNTPTTSSKHIQTHVTLDNNSSIFIGGLNSLDDYETIKSIPFIEYIPILGTATTHTVKENKNITFSIVITAE